MTVTMLVGQVVAVVGYCGAGRCIHESGKTLCIVKNGGRVWAFTPSQTAWALMGILTVCGGEDRSAQRGVRHLVDTQDDILSQGDGGAAWTEREFTSTGFPNHFYISYNRVYFPITALERRAERKEKAGGA
ncbi:hypothetical protein N7465_007331 [Penicillium sp. CMV-2018d]|nr:hypothetical protein N7465_007331 [Penicillium sp. CMV-2018d]